MTTPVMTIPVSPAAEWSRPRHLPRLRDAMAAVLLAVFATASTVERATAQAGPPLARPRADSAPTLQRPTSPSAPPASVAPRTSVRAGVPSAAQAPTPAPVPAMPRASVAVDSVRPAPADATPAAPAVARPADPATVRQATTALPSATLRVEPDLPPPAGATARCRDGSYVTTPVDGSTCDGRGGLAVRLPVRPVPGPRPPNRP